MIEKSKLAQTLPSGTTPSKVEPHEANTSEIPATRELQTTLAGDSVAMADTLDGSVPTTASASADVPGYVVAQRYRLIAVLGRGAHGRVWEADDLIAGGKVALKILSPDLGAWSARIRREVASMRLLRLSGVVQLLDEGTDVDRPFIVMERVHGAPFPGVPVPAPWAAIAPAAIALLETLARMHALGIVHRDLKPANVLVDAAGRPTILDFGLARVDTSLDEGVTDHGTILGTPAYLAPEQVNGDPATARSDLYAIGVMIFEALSGRFPHPLENIMRMLRARVCDPPAPLASVAPDVPRAITAFVDALLAREPARRPRSAIEVLEQLRGGRAVKRPSLRRLGPRDAVSALVDAAVAGASLDVCGPRGSGRTRCLDDVAADLTQRGHNVLPASIFAASPIEPAPPTVRVGPQREAAPPAVPPAQEPRAPHDGDAMERSIRAALEAGAVVIADDVDAIDPVLATALDRCREAGSVLRAFTRPPQNAPRAVTLRPLSEADLVALFVGTSRLFHIPEDAARVLHRRTDGLPARVAADVTGWVHAGLARWDGDRVSLDRDVIERLEAGLVITPLEPMPPPKEPLPPALDDLLHWVALAHPNGNAAHLALARQAPLDEVEAGIADLEARGALRVLPDGRFEPSCAPGTAEPWPIERRREAHRRIAFAEPRGTPRRLFHLLTGADDDVELSNEIAAEAQHLARRLAIEGRLGLAAAAVSEGLRAERRLGTSGAVESLPLLTLAVEIALEDGTPRALDRALYELYRVRPRSPAIERLAHLVSAALAIFQRTPRALGEVTDLDPFSAVDLERRRHGLRVMGVRMRSQAEEAALLEEIRTWVEASGDLASRAAYSGWLGRLRYREGRFVEAADLHAACAADERWVTARLSALLRSASARMEAFQLEQAASTAREARDSARHHRLPFQEAWAEWIHRSAIYRSGGAMSADLPLCEASEMLRVRDMEAMLCLNEAAIAWRAGDHEVAASLAARARHAWAALGEVSSGALLAAALRIACGVAQPDQDDEALVQRALDSVAMPRIGVQALGLLAKAGFADRIDAAQAAKLARRTDERWWDQRLEVLSIREAMDAISALPRSPPSRA